MSIFFKIGKKDKEFRASSTRIDKLYEKKEEIWLSPNTKAPTPTEKSKKQCENIKKPPQTLIAQRLRFVCQIHKYIHFCERWLCEFCEYAVWYTFDRCYLQHAIFAIIVSNEEVFWLINLERD